MNAPIPHLDRRALLDGMSVAAMIALPVQLLARIAFDEDDRSGWAFVVTLLILSGLVLGAGVAAWRQRYGTPLTHGLVTALGTYVAIQTVFTVVRIVQDDPVRWGRIATSLALSAVAGIMGGMLGSWMLRRGVVPPR